MFERRRRDGERFELEVERYLVRHPDILAVGRSGTEHTLPEFMPLLRRDRSESAKFIRFAPDGVAAPRGDPAFHWEAKHSKYIERAAWETYVRHEQAGCRVLLFLRSSLGVFHAWASQLPFIDSHEFVQQYPEERRFPVDEGWIYPRRNESEGRLLTGSGTPFRVIDYSRCPLLMGLDEWALATADRESD
jgi:hypothetical protein